MEYIFSETNALVMATMVCCFFFLSNAPKLTRYGILFYGLSLGIEAMAFEGLAALIARSACVTIAAVLMTLWAYRVTNRPRAERNEARHPG